MVFFSSIKILFSSSFVWGLNKDRTTSPAGFIKKVAGTAGGVSIPQISLGCVIKEGTSMLNLSAIGSKSSTSKKSTLNVKTSKSSYSFANSFNSGISLIHGA